jgi:hypothetical protein
MACKHLGFAYEEPRSNQSVRKVQVHMVGDSTPHQAAKTHRVHQRFLLQTNGNAPKQFLKCPTVGDDAGILVCPFVDDIRLQRVMTTVRN